MSAYKHIIWDWNGTLIDDTWLCLEIMNTQLKKRDKKTVSYAQYQRFFDFPVKNFYKKIGFDFDEESYENVAQNFIREYTKRRFECSLHFGVPTILQKFKSFGIEHSILSAYAEKELGEMIEHFDLKGYFNNVFGLNNHYAAGKHKEGEALIAKLNIATKAIIMIGDTYHDYEVAKHLGIDCILISQGHQSELKLESSGVPVVRNLSEAMWHIV